MSANSALKLIIRCYFSPDLFYLKGSNYDILMCNKCEHGDYKQNISFVTTAHLQTQKYINIYSQSATCIKYSFT